MGRPQGAYGNNRTRLEHDHRQAFQRARCQAKFRKEKWNLTLEDFIEIWHNHWHQRGRDATSLVMTRHECSDEWSLSNIKLITRSACSRDANNHKSRLVA